MRSSADAAGRGPVPFSEVMDLALYEPAHGFYATGGAAGRRGDFITSPEVGPLFGAVVARALDEWWRAWGEPDPFVVVEAGAGAGTLAISVLAAQPACSAALRYVLVERSAALRAASSRAPGARGSRTRLRARPRRGRGRRHSSSRGRDGSDRREPRLHAPSARSLRRDRQRVARQPRRSISSTSRRRWFEVRVGLDGDRLAETLVPGDGPELMRPRVHVSRCRHAARRWVRDAASSGRRGGVRLRATRPRRWPRDPGEWLRTYRGHHRGAAPARRSRLSRTSPARSRSTNCRRRRACATQADWLRAHGIDELVEQGRRAGRNATLADLEAIGPQPHHGSRSPHRPGGLGGFCVMEWDWTIGA